MMYGIARIIARKKFFFKKNQLGLYTHRILPYTGKSLENGIKKW